ncbi:MAG: hypothetical protein M0Q91_06480 [Methanoregula sp.]|jgi:hypothetical protein|nr:hypothetical protein [Methanoregula sp.]
MKLLFILVILLVMALLGVLPVCADESQGTVPGQNPRDSFVIMIDPIGNHYSGDSVLIQGLTNIPFTENLRVEVYSSSNHPGRNRVFYGISQVVPVMPGENDSMNYWSIEVPTNNWSTDEYLATAFPDTDMETHDRGYAGEVFNLFAANERPAENITPAKTALPPLQVQAALQVTPVLTAPTQPAPLSLLVPLTAIGALLIVSGILKRKM